MVLLSVTKLRKVYCLLLSLSVIFFKSVNIWQSYNQEGCLVHFVRLATIVLTDAVRIVYGKRLKTVECLTARPSVCPVDRQQQWRPVGLLLRSGGEADIDR